jgi:lysophospholipase L1-like esterase
MSAKHGSTRKVGRLVVCCLAAVLALSAVFATAASAKKTPPPPTKTYLALGDSLAFGYSQQLYNENWSMGDPATAFEAGYVNDYAKKLEGKKETELVNLGCPGETTKSLIGNKAIGAALESAFGATTEAPCAYQEGWNAFHKDGTGGPLHTSYVGKSQLEAALEQVAIAAGSGRPVSHVTLNIGANDELAAVHACEKEVGEEYGKEGKSKYGETPESAVKGCLEAHVPALIKTIVTNTEAAAYAIRHGAEFGGVNYSGPITFMASYDPYGNVSGSGEVLPGSVGLAAVINGVEEEKFKQGFNPEKNEFGFEACVANPLHKFNPQSKAEPKHLQEWTNMANTSETEVEPGVKKANGPDIHPTPKGYKVLAGVIKKSCGV